ncbi:uncharacterized protein LAESUDRAFT_447517 [Laetiporus sulphureus 93-53]|uniref:Secreted protein n=1 Tax=Laetiporus sulphureus 93-53 TaxID=1314785 RepID=A0A165BYG1_9APHY|nr:uncharacterized protein LAESUDRAFT_447517 [Laetiporus sulphureus 93-53]KZT01877.1 hypothetical protein LAESUDRAFT_447517 [Laetiporus sulphureus 93-53]
MLWQHFVVWRLLNRLSSSAHAANTESSLMCIALPHNRVFLRSIDNFKPCYHDARLWVANFNQVFVSPFEETCAWSWRSHGRIVLVRAGAGRLSVAQLPVFENAYTFR